MKHLLLFISFAVMFTVSCRKELSDKQEDDFINRVQDGLKATMQKNEFGKLDFSRMVRGSIQKEKITLVRVPFNDKSIANDFVLLQTTESGKLIKGVIINIKGTISKEHLYNGSLSIGQLQGTPVAELKIINGFSQRRPGAISSNTVMAEAPPVQPDPFEMLPEVIVTASYPPSGGTNYTPIYNLMTFFSDASSGGGSGWYSNSDPFGGGGGGGGGGGPVITDPPIQIDFDSQYDDPAIDIEKFMKCFSDIPDAGATGSIEIHTDLPVDGDPSIFFDWSNGSPGHTFITIRKRNGSQSASQNIGFYPVRGWKTTISPAPINGKFVDNGQHEYNATMTISLTPAQIQNAVVRILYLAGFVRYDIDDYNCTDWALDVFNNTVHPSQKLDIPRYNIPGGEAPNGTSTPQGLYLKLQALKQAGGTQAAGIDVPVIGSAGNSSGPCN